ncbi:hypothetical protein E1A91_A13G162000v1 [Gossypium mustelinum]|uniref:Uncharacterized protein n=1 Tax=Gossypium mustelinum TaxID=34275 RepID=A0A5D2WI82_GOSMU|nr:hypothetical protein E1A91_A13G162000v1 [Gossypium mustelinum]
MRRRYFHGESSLKLETPSSGPAPLFRKADRKFLPSKAVSNNPILKWISFHEQTGSLSSI